MSRIRITQWVNTLCVRLVCGGRPTFKHTRIEITGALARLAAGETLEMVVTGYEGRVTPEAVLEASEIMAREFLSHLPKLQAA